MVVRAVGLILLCRHGSHILTIEERKDKPAIEKKAGMVSFPLETLEDGESYDDALRRLLKEEIGIAYNNITLPGQCGVFSRQFESGIIAHYVIYMSQCRGTIRYDPHDDDVVFHGWLRPHDLETYPCIRIEVRHFLDVCMANGRACA